MWHTLGMLSRLVQIALIKRKAHDEGLHIINVDSVQKIATLIEHGQHFNVAKMRGRGLVAKNTLITQLAAAHKWLESQKVLKHHVYK